MKTDTERKAAPPQSGLNILLITVDQWRADLSGPGRRFPTPTPHLDALAARGTVFARHFTQAYPCGPARASLYTGLYAHKHRSVVNGMPLDARHPTVFQCLRAAGYRPTLFGYTDVTLDPRGKPVADPDNGDYEGVCPGIAPALLLTERATPWLTHLTQRGVALGNPDAGRKGVFAQRPFGEPTVFSASDSETAFLADAFIGWLKVAGATPFCAHLSFIAPHPPIAVPADQPRRIDTEALPSLLRGKTPETEAGQSPYTAALIRSTRADSALPGVAGLASDLDDGRIALARRLYAEMAAEVDFQLGRILAALDEAGLRDDTLIVFTGDHGDQMFDHWMLGKVGYFDQSAHIPLIIADPRPLAAPGRGRVVRAFTEAVDILPTLLDAVGLKAPRNCDGRSLLPFCAGETPAEWRDAAHWAVDFRDIVTRQMETALGLPFTHCNLQVVRTDRLKYVHFAGLPPVLFDLANDPDELINRADDPACAALRLEGAERLLRWRQQNEEHTLTGHLARRGRLHTEMPEV